MWDCKDCNLCTLKLKEYPYLLKGKIWELTGLTDNGDDGMLCIHCCEKRLNRKLCKQDFDLEFRKWTSPTRILLENGQIYIIKVQKKSSRLINRMRRSRV